MEDSVYKKQLEQFGIESNRIVRGDVNKKRQEERREATSSVVKLLMGSSQGRQWMYSILDICRTFTSPFVAGHADVSAFFSGAQSIGHRMLDDIMAVAPESFYVMMQEEAARVKALSDSFSE